MQGLWKEELGGWNHKGSRRKKASRKDTLRDKRLAILQDFYHDGRNAKHITRIENEQTITWIGNRWGPVYPLPKYADICKIGFIIPLKGDEYNEWKGSYVHIKAYHKGGPYNGMWYEADTDKTIRDFFNLSFQQSLLIRDRNIYIESTHGKKLLDWSEEIKKRVKVHVKDFTHGTQREFVYDKPIQRYLKWSMYTESPRRTFAHKHVNGQTRRTVRDWIAKGDWDAERVIPHYEKSYAWMID